MTVHGVTEMTGGTRYSLFLLQMRRNERGRRARDSEGLKAKMDALENDAKNDSDLDTSSRSSTARYLLDRD